MSQDSLQIRNNSQGLRAAGFAEFGPFGRRDPAHCDPRFGVSEVTDYRWRQECGGLKIEQVKRLKELELEKENGGRLSIDA